ncbi:hypothetical protein EFK50_06680 [Nocardioides marmoriginsengisoli]|uniref:Uncharacterized protein n=1 Tax=Nocardioides marmoriginsengisoli TaxID=661483 RepID=A0A3N0CMT2_9ACTN|nr:hypothetical protein [Nocardioides marmoriginsengisoli]RNL64213.1 hypothetical protein EFK50_06680 [Nocardioides marmoriginsengisoli]
MTKPFGEDLGKNLRAVQVTRDGGINVPVRADRDGIRLGTDAVATPPAPRRSRRSLLRRLFRRS